MQPDGKRLAGALLGMGLMVIFPSMAAAQETDDGEAVGLGGRIEVIESGYALTLPEDWLRVRPSDAEVDAIVDAIRRTAPGLEAAIRPALDGDLGFSLLAFDTDVGATFAENCNMLDRASDGQVIDAIGQAEFLQLADFDEYLAREPVLTFVELPAGRAAQLDVDLDLPEFVTASTSYILTDGVWMHTLTCTDLARPDDAWRSIADTFEFLTTVE